MKIFMNGGRKVELSKAEIIQRTRDLVRNKSPAQGEGLLTIYFKKLPNGMEESYYSPKGLTGIGSNEGAKKVAAIIRGELGCKAWVYRRHDEVSGDYCTVLVGPFERVDWRKPVRERLVHKYSSAEIFRGGKIHE